MASSNTRRKLAAAAAVLVVAASVGAIVIRGAGSASTTGNAIDTEPLTTPNGYVEPMLRDGQPVPTVYEQDFVEGPAQDATDTAPDDSDAPQAKTRQKPRRKKKEQTSKPDEHGIYYDDQGKVDYSKMPPMGG